MEKIHAEHAFCECSAAAAVSSKIDSSNTLIAHHQVLLLCNGSVLDAILLWRSNVQKAFEGVEPCPICYAVIDTHNQVLQLVLFYSASALLCSSCHA
jgi:hypothetical protein